MAKKPLYLLRHQGLSVPTTIASIRFTDFGFDTAFVADSDDILHHMDVNGASATPFTFYVKLQSGKKNL